MNDFTFLGRSFQVNAQADSKFRVTAADILKLKTRSVEGKMVPLSTMASVEETFGPGVVTRYNLYTGADLSGDTKQGYSPGHAIRVLEDCAALPPVWRMDRPDLSANPGGNTAFHFPLCVLFVFLTLAAQYESWALPFSIILIVPNVPAFFACGRVIAWDGQ